MPAMDEAERVAIRADAIVTAEIVISRVRLVAQGFRKDATREQLMAGYNFYLEEVERRLRYVRLGKEE